MKLSGLFIAAVFADQQWDEVEKRNGKHGRVVMGNKEMRGKAINDAFTFNSFG